MKYNLLLTLFVLLICVSQTRAQNPVSFTQYFDGADTSITNSLVVIPDTSAGNIWQIGKPQKTLFNSAATIPNVIITDTINYYPVSNVSSFSIKFKLSSLVASNVLAIRWKQKLDLQKKEDGAIVEFSKNGGPWQNILNNTNVYNLYGYAQANKDTLLTGDYAFSGTDTTWRDIWLCFRNNYLRTNDSITIRYTLQTDTNANAKEGWMIDNMLIQRTFVHTVAQVPSSHDSKVYPTTTTGTIFVESEHLTPQHVIKSIVITDASGKVVRQYSDEQQRFIIDIGDQPTGTYYVKVVTNLGKETFPVLLHH